MSGVCGCNKIQGRSNFKAILNEVEELIKGFKGFKSVSPTGSYNSDLNKTQFGDMDIITHIEGDAYNFDKKVIKQELAKYFLKQSPDIVTKFTSEKYSGRRYYNSGEIITIAFKSKQGDIESAQVDFIISMDEVETKFKLDFLDMPSAKQGLVLGLVKTVLIENEPRTLLNRMKIHTGLLQMDQEFEFNLSSTELQLRKVTYHTGTLKQKKREIVWTSRDWTKLEYILKSFDLSGSFEDLVVQSQELLKNPRSYRRLAGIFKSMISIKSGEVGKTKGIDKQKSLDLIEHIFGEKVMNTHGIFIGRFQPITNAHTNIIKQIGEENDVATIFIVKGKQTSKNKEVNPFDIDIQMKMLESVIPSNVNIKVLPSAFFVDEINTYSDDNFVIYAGSDRIKAYESFKKYMDDGKVLNTKEITRTDEDVSATKVRKALTDNDESTFKNMVPIEIHEFYARLKDINNN